MVARRGLARIRKSVLRLLPPAALLLPLACSSRGVDSSSTGDDARIVPEGLAVTTLAGGNGVLAVIALTLRRGPSHIELYAALRNNGAIPACNAALSVELFDKAERSLAAGISGLLTPGLYRLSDDTDTIAACLGPGDVAMVAITDLPAELVIEAVGTIVYRTPYFALDVEPIVGLSISEVRSVTNSAGSACTGTLVNGLEVALKSPSVTVFPVNRAGRPLGMAVGSSTVAIPPGGSWAFDITTIGTPAVACSAYPSGAPGN
jgi:hypothetical protein